jgi:hypothetical protein
MENKLVNDECETATTKSKTTSELIYKGGKYVAGKS